MDTSMDTAMDAAMRIITPHVGQLLSFNDRTNMTLVAKCFSSAHENDIYQTWAFLPRYIRTDFGSVALVTKYSSSGSDSNPTIFESSSGIFYYPSLKQKFTSLLKKNPKIKFIDIILSIPIESDIINELYEFVNENISDKLAISVLISNRIAIDSFCKFLYEYSDKIHKYIIKNYFAISCNDTEILKELGLILISTNQCINYLKISGSNSIFNTIVQFKYHIHELQIYHLPNDVQVEESVINDLKCIPVITFTDFPTYSLCRIMTHLVDVVFELGGVHIEKCEICDRLELLILNDFQSTQYLKKPDIITRFINNLPKNITIDFRKKSLVDPGIISIISLISQKRSDITIKITIFSIFNEKTICGLLANMHLKTIKNYIFDASKSFVFNWNFTYKELLTKLQDTDIYLYMLWSQLKHPI